MVRIAITGGIACGKSLVGSFMHEAGIAVCEADELGHELMRSGTPVTRELVEVFGSEILAPDGGVDRKTLGGLVFADSIALERLNAITHPWIRSAWVEWLERSGDKVSAVIIPLFFETGESGGWDSIVCVATDEPVQLRRLIEGGLDETEARRRISAQMPTVEKIVLSDYVVLNNESVDLLKHQTMRVLDSILER